MLWVELVAIRERQRALLYRAANAALLKVFTLWRRGPKRSKVAARIANLPLAKAFDAWASRLAEMQLARRSLAHMTNRGLSKALLSWYEYLDMLETMRRGAAAFASGGLKRGFNGWCAWVDVRMEMEAKVRAAAAALRSGLRKAFNTWADLIGTVDPRKRALLHLLNRRLASGWRGWVRMGARWKHFERPPARPPGLGAAPLAPHPPGMPPAPVLPEADVHAEK